MRISEIITNIGRDEPLNKYQYVFDDADVVDKINKLELKRVTEPDAIYYGLFDGDVLVGYLELNQYNDRFWEVILVQLEGKIKGRGYGTALYDYAVLNDGLTVLSDMNNSTGQFSSKELWLRLKRNNRYNVFGYDTDSDTVLSDATPEDVYNEKENMRWIAFK